VPAKTSKKWLTVTVTCPEKIAEAVSDQMGVLSGAGVEVRPANSSGRQQVTGYFFLDAPGGAGDLEETAGSVLQGVTDELEKLYAIYNLILHEPVTSIIDDQDWATSWQQFFTTTEIVPGLVIKPSWEHYSPAAGQRVITMDPGMAFGTGQHASTRMALGLLVSCFNGESGTVPGRVLDIGTGTGILAMGAAAFGADEITAIDNDPEAVTVALHNVNVNHFDWNIGVSSRPLEDLAGPFDLICANIVHDVLVEMVPAISRLAAAQSRVILSGILQGEQERNILQIYGQAGLHLVRSEHDEEWSALLLEMR